MNGDPNRADCALVDTWLDDWLAGHVPAQVAQRIANHLAGCPRCQRLAAIVRDDELRAGEFDGSPAFGDGQGGDAEPGRRGDLVSAVLSQTTGSPCARAEALLPALADDELDAGSREILQAHLAHCDGCTRLLAALQEAARVLPALAEIQTPPGFAERVLHATTAAPSSRAFGGAAWEWTLRILARPRASLELAYVATVLLVVLLGNPVAAFYQAEQRASQLAGAVPVAHLSEQLGITEAAAGTLGRIVAGVASVFSAVQSQIAAWWDQARAMMQGIGTAIGDAIAWITNVDVGRLFRTDTQPPPRGQPAGSPARSQGAATEPGARR